MALGDNDSALVYKKDRSFRIRSMFALLESSVMGRFTRSVGHEILRFTMTVISIVLKGGFMKQIKWVNGVSNVSLLELISKRVEFYPLFFPNIAQSIKENLAQNDLIIEMMGFIVCSQKNKKHTKTSL